MAIFKTFSQRKREAEKAAKGDPDPFAYNTIPSALRNQIAMILREALGPAGFQVNASHWRNMEQTLKKAHGLLTLGTNGDVQTRYLAFMLTADDELCIDAIEVAFIQVARLSILNPGQRVLLGMAISPESAITELNERFLQHGIGYEFLNGQLVQRDQSDIHPKAVRPAFVLMAGDERFAPVQQELSKAYENLRGGAEHYPDAIGNAAKALESALKVGCRILKIPLPKQETAQPLISAFFKSDKAVPPYLMDHASHLAGAMQGLATIGNKDGRHGKDKVPTLPRPLVEFALHLAASNILFIVRSVQAHR